MQPLTLWRVCRPGNALACTSEDARWHSGSRQVLYASLDAAGAVLEALAHHREKDGPVYDLVNVTLTVPDAAPANEVAVDDLPDGWQRKNGVTQRLGNAWYDRNEATYLIVPSALVDHARNVLVNVTHGAWTAPAFVRQAFRFDPRLLNAGKEVRRCST